MHAQMYSVRRKLVVMVINLNKNPISYHTERYRKTGLSLEFLGEMVKKMNAVTDFRSIISLIE